EPERRQLRRGRRQRRLGLGPRLLPDRHQRPGRERLADHRHQLHAGAQGRQAGYPRGPRLLPLGLRQRRRSRHLAGLRAAAGFAGAADRGLLGAAGPEVTARNPPTRDVHVDGPSGPSFFCAPPRSMTKPGALSSGCHENIISWRHRNDSHRDLPRMNASLPRFATLGLCLALALSACTRESTPAASADAAPTDAAAPAGDAIAVEVTGAGASFVYPLVSKWSADYNKATGNKVNYQSIGSGGGIAQIKAGTVDFGSSDKPLPPEELAQ